MADVGHEIAVEAAIEGFMAMVLLTAATATISDMEQRQIDKEKVLEEGYSPYKEIVIWQTMF